MPEALLLSLSDLEKALDFASVLAVIEEAFHAERRGGWDTPKRIAARSALGGLLAMPCAGGTPASMGAKLVTTFPANTARGQPSVSGLYALFDPDTGVLQAVMDGGYLTLVRTAAVSALATRLLAREDAKSLGVLGAGAQAEFHLRLIATVRPVEQVTVWARKRFRAETLVASLRSRDELGRVASWRVADDAREAAGCDIVVSATAATEPVLLGRWLGEGSLVIPIGAHTRTTREIDSETVTRASLLAVETADTLEEAGDLQMAEDEAGGVVRRVVTLGALLDPTRSRSRDRRAIAIFKSCGVAFEDLAVAALAYRRALEAKLGTRFSFG
jgi:ornithine cyclodeaminase/alanine dehydrogenase-like protein (mu-crystallin family)